MRPTTLLKHTSHLRNPLPNGPWVYYQEWNQAVFLHFEVPVDLLQAYLPDGLEADSHEGKAYVSLVPFKMEKIRPRFLPAVPLISNFWEINLRTYVRHGMYHGVYFLGIEAEKSLSAWVARSLSGLPYNKAEMVIEEARIQSTQATVGQKLDLHFEVGEAIQNKSALEIWLTERYCLFLERHGGLSRYDIHHLPWELSSLKRLEIQQLVYPCLGKQLQDFPLIGAQYSKGVQVLAWPRQPL